MFVFGAQTAKSTQLARKIWAGTDPVGRNSLKDGKSTRREGLLKSKVAAKPAGGRGGGKHSGMLHCSAFCSVKTAIKFAEDARRSNDKI